MVEASDPNLLQKEKESKKELEYKLFKLLLQKYSEVINEQEKRTIGEIKGLVNGDDLTIQSILADLKPQNYEFSKHYYETAKKVFEFVTKEINYVEVTINLNYWLTPKEILTEKVGDDEDIAVFLCSLLFGLGDEKAEVVIAELENLKTHAFVITEIHGTFFLLDACQKHSFEEFAGDKDDVLTRYAFNGSKIKRFLYKFNHANYEQFM